MTATLEDAKRCPRCNESGEQTSKAPGKRRSTILTFTCKNERCKWYNTHWVVQVREDGTIPERMAGPKDFPTLDPHAEAIAKRQLEELAAAGDEAAIEFLRRDAGS